MVATLFDFELMTNDRPKSIAFQTTTGVNGTKAQYLKTQSFTKDNHIQFQ